MILLKPRFCLPTEKSPTYYNLAYHLQQSHHWRPTRFNRFARLSEKNFEFDESVAQQLEFKHLLASLCQKYTLPFVPKTYIIHDHNWQQIVYSLAQQSSQQPWILKPSMLNNGQHIQLFSDTSQIMRHYLNPYRLNGFHVLQAYINNPHLLQQHKYSMRVFVVLTQHCGAYIYPDGYFNIASTIYTQNNLQNKSAHLTNEHLQPEQSTTQIPTQRFAIFPPFYDQIKHIVKAVLHALEQENQGCFQSSKKPIFALFGFDFMTDTDQRVWLLEANHGPCFPINPHHVLQKHLYHSFWNDFIQNFCQTGPRALTQFERLI